MSKLFARVASYLSSRTQVGVDKVGNRYFTRKEEIDGVLKEKRWVIFKGEDDPTSISVEWICWLNGQRKQAPTPEEMMELEARRERVKQNVALLKKEEEEKRAKEGRSRKIINPDKVGGPDLGSFIRQFPTAPEGDKVKEESDSTSGPSKKTSSWHFLATIIEEGYNLQKFNTSGKSSHEETTKEKSVPESSEPMGSGPSFRPGTWQPPT